MHGYDVLDHTRVSAGARRRGGAACALAATAREHGLGLVVDVVPNHMALVAPEISQRPAVGGARATGRDAAHAHWFDVDWEALDGPASACRCSGSTLADDAGRGRPGAATSTTAEPVIRYHDHVFPVGARHRDGDDVADGARPEQHYLLAGWRETDDDAQLPPLLRRRRR